MNKETGKKVKATAVAAVTAASLLVGGSYTAPDDIFSDDDGAIVRTFTSSLSDGDGGADGGGSEERGSRRGIRAAVRSFTDSLSDSVRALVILPLWSLGAVLISLSSALWSAVLSPAAATVLGWIAVALIVLAVFIMTVKTVLPDLPLKKLLNKRSVLTVVVSCFVFGILDALLPIVCDDYEKLSQLMRLAASLVCTLVPTAFFLRRHSMKQSVSEQVGLSDDERERDAIRLAAELADSVCPKYR